MTMLLAASAAFLFLHFGISGTRLRDVLVRQMGEGAYLGLYSIASAAGIVWLAIAYNTALAAGSAPLWEAPKALSHAGLIIIGLAFVAGLPGVLMPSPTGVAQGGIARNPDAVRGVLRITRHPFLWSAALWAAFHLAVNGDEASVVFFGTFLALSVFGTYSIDAKRARALGADWQAFAQRTSNIPFAAILGGRQTLNVSELLTWRQGLALLVFVGVALTHHLIFGVSPFPGGWVPPFLPGW
ncbi:MAG TPA: NnrU family protein [Alphaproteobacteria bacterium]|nr:NnrU family protein [Alphaproteobacteria bacterium]HAJ45026.1 NnrU family protein [Alphaproteobacteria bacterium]